MNIKYFQKGFNFSQDGPGNRLVYHLQGCNMRCPWCSNPEGMRVESNAAKQQSVDEIVSDILRSKKMFFDGGGVTFTGGEATCQFEALKEVLEKVHGYGINTCIETNGTNKNLEQMVPTIDHMILDLKHYNDEIHKNVTGISNEEIKKNIEMLSKKRVPVLIRTPLIHGFNDSTTDIEGFLKFYHTIDTKDMSFEILTYHEYGKEKWEKMGLEYQVEDGYVTREQKAEFEEKYRKQGLRIIHT